MTLAIIAPKAMNPAIVRNERRKEKSFFIEKAVNVRPPTSNRVVIAAAPMLDGLIYAATVNRGAKIRDSANT